MSEGQVLTGECRWFDLKKGYGFLNLDDTPDNDVFVHHSNLKADGFALLRAGQRVRFVVGKDKTDKPTALEVTAEDGSLLRPDAKVPRRRPRTTRSREANNNTTATTTDETPKEGKRESKREPKKEAKREAPKGDRPAKPERAEKPEKTEKTEKGEAQEAQKGKKNGRRRKPRRVRSRFVESDAIKALKEQTSKAMVDAFGSAPQFLSFASGRVNLIGEHVDYNDGLVFPFAIHLGTCVAGIVREDDGPHVRVVSTNIKENNKQNFEIDEALSDAKWVNYIKGVVFLFNAQVAKVPKLDLVISSTVPLGSGLSSSASLEVAVCTLLENITHVRCASASVKAALCVEAEHSFAKVPCGIMDQSIAVMGREGHALLLDCRTKRAKHVPLGSEGGEDIALVVVNTNVSHALVDGEYAKRKQQCIEGLELLKKQDSSLTSLRDATLALVDTTAAENKNSIPINRVRHVVGEIARVEHCVEALKKNDFQEAGRLMYESHDSLRDLYEVSCKELDVLVELAKTLDGVYGSRMTGGGFGGCTITLCKAESAPKVLEELERQYKAKTGIEPKGFVTKPSTGTRSLKVN